MSDVFGELIDQSFGGSSNDNPSVKWQMGEDLPASIGVIRSMSNPHEHQQPDKMTDTT
jgi:Zn-dependent metalloprotease